MNIVRKAVIFGVWEGVWGEVPVIRCDVEVRVRPKLFRIVIRMDGGFKTTGLGPWTYLPSPDMVDSAAFWHKTSGTSDDAYAAPTEASLLESGVPNTPTHPLNYPEELWAPSSNLRISSCTFNIVFGRTASAVYYLAEQFVA